MGYSKQVYGTSPRHSFTCIPDKPLVKEDQYPASVPCLPVNKLVSKLTSTACTAPRSAVLYEVVPPSLQRRACSTGQHNVQALRQRALFDVHTGRSLIQELIVYARGGHGLEQGHSDKCLVEYRLECRGDYLGPVGGTKQQHQVSQVVIRSFVGGTIVVALAVVSEYHCRGH